MEGSYTGFGIFLPHVVFAQLEMTPSEWLDLFVDACVGSGSSSVLSGTVDASGELFLKRFNAKVEISGLCSNRLTSKKCNNSGRLCSMW
jgi:hypothetical protein